VPKVRVLVVDDSAFARKVLRESLSASPMIEVVGTARDGLEALEKIAELEPDVITLDLVMPNLDGIGVLRSLDRERGPRVVVVSISDGNSDLGIEALQNGAVDLVHKPTALATDRLFELSAELRSKVLAAANAARWRPRATTPQAPIRQFSKASAVQIVVIGTSTGGPQALSHVVPALPPNFPVPVAIALHIPAGYTDALARRLNEVSAVDVVEARDEIELRAGLVVIARGGAHLVLGNRDGKHVARVDYAPSSDLYTPSVDRLFHSAAAEFGGGVLGVVLTGMGDDGVIGARAIHAAGGLLLTESESSAIIYGMPRCVYEAGLNASAVPLTSVVSEICARL
jgi:two-component system chemotaxis response regulator CheB